MSNWTINQAVDLARGHDDVVVWPNTLMVPGDNEGHSWCVEVRDRGKPADLSGYTAKGYFVRCDNPKSVVYLDGEVNGNIVSVTMKQECYAIEGPLRGILRITKGEQTVTIVETHFHVRQGIPDRVVDAGGIIPSLDAIVSQYNAMKEATANAIAAAEAASAAASASTPPILLDASGPLITLTDGAARPAAALTSGISALQEGTGDPSPANIRPIAGRDAVTLFGAGRNLLVLEDESFTRGGVAVTVDKRGVLTFDGTSSLSSTGTVRFTSMTLPAGTYTLSGTVIGGSMTNEGATIAFVDVDGTFYRVKANALSTTFTLGSRQEISIGCMVAAGGAVYEDYAVQIQLECGSEATAWQPSAVASIEASLPETVYGGSIDWLGGDVTIDRMLISFDGTENWQKNATSANTVRLTTPAGAASVVAASHYLVRSTSNSANDMSTIIGTQLNFRDSVNAVDVDTWKAYLAAQAAAGTPVTILCAMTAPRSIALDPLSITLIEGENNLWCDCGDTALTYVADTRLYIDQRLAAIAAASLDV